MSSTGSRWRLLSGALLVVAVGVRLSPGTLADEGSLAVVVDPERFLRIALSGWSQVGAGFADDASARLAPLAALYALGDAAGLAPWISQLVLRTGVLLLAFVGGVFLSRSVLGRNRLEVVAGLFAALNPVLLGRAVTSLPDALALAVAPLVIAPLLSPQRYPSARRAALSAALPTILLGPAELTWSAGVLAVALGGKPDGAGRPRATYRLVAAVHRPGKCMVVVGPRLGFRVRCRPSRIRQGRQLGVDAHTAAPGCDGCLARGVLRRCACDSRCMVLASKVEKGCGAVPRWCLLQVLLYFCSKSWPDRSAWAWCPHHPGPRSHRPVRPRCCSAWRGR